MHEASVGGQLFTYQPLAAAPAGDAPAPPPD